MTLAPTVPAIVACGAASDEIAEIQQELATDVA